MKIIRNVKVPLIKNFSYIVLASISSSAFGFIFWILAAKFYSPDSVGIATALISSMTLLTLLSRLGLDNSIIRFMPENNQNEVFTTCNALVIIFTLILGIIYILGIDIFTPKLYLLKTPINSTIFLLFLVANAVASMTGVSFVALRKAEYYFIQNIFIGLRAFLILPLTFLGTMGIFCSVGFSFIFATLISLFYLSKMDLHFKMHINKEFISKSFHFSAGNYIAGLFMTGPNLILPLMILNILGPEKAAYYYLDFSIASLLFMIPNATSTSLFVEGSYGQSMGESVLKSILLVYSILIPLVIVVYVSGGWILNLIGNSYSAEGLELLYLLIITSFFIAITSTYSSIKRIQNDIKELIIINGIIFVILLLSSYILMNLYGIIGVGYSWFISNLIGSIIIILISKKDIINFSKKIYLNYSSCLN